MDFFTKMMQEAPLEIDEEYFMLAKEYKEKFGCIVPREMMPPSITDDKVKEAIKTCLESEDGDICKLLGIEKKRNVLY